MKLSWRGVLAFGVVALFAIVGASVWYISNELKTIHDRVVTVVNLSGEPVTLTYAQSSENTWHTPVVTDIQLDTNSRIDLTYGSGDWISINQAVLPEFAEDYLNQADGVVQLQEQDGLWIVRIETGSKLKWTTLKPAE